MDQTSQHLSHASRTSKRRRWLALSAGFAVLLLLSALNPGTMQAALREIGALIDLDGGPLSASPPKLSEHVIAELASMEPQKQAEMLVQRATNHYEGAIELIGKHVDSWRGKINLTPQFNGMLSVAIKFCHALGADLREFKADPCYLFPLHYGQFGPEEYILTVLCEETRFWAVEGLGLLGRDETIQPLLDTFKSDPAMRVRERAGCSLAQSGMLTKQQRMTAVPALLDMAQDASVDATTRGWVFQALRDITGENLGTDPEAWRAWWLRAR